MKIFRLIEGVLNGGFLPKAATVGVAAPRKRAANFLAVFRLAALCRGAATTLLLLAGTVRGQFTPVVWTVNQSGGVQGIAINRTNVIGEGSGGATAINLTNGVQSGLTTPGNLIDAGQFNDGNTLYLNSAGSLYWIQNWNGSTLGQYSVPGATAVSSAVVVGGEYYAYLAGGSIGVERIKLSDGTLTPVPALTNFPANLQGMDVFLRPGASGNSFDDYAFGFQSGTGTPNVKIYYPDGTLAGTFYETTANGTIRDVSFDVARNQIWCGTQANLGTGTIFNASFDYSAYAVEPAVSAGWTNGQLRVAWAGRQLQGSTNLTAWQTLSNAPQPYLTPATNAPQFFRAVK